MKHLLKICTVFLTAVLMFGCSNPKFSDLELKDGVYYIKGKTEPYSGKIDVKYKSGKDSLVGNIEKGKLSGVLLNYYDNGNIKDSVVYVAGELKLSKTFAEDGKPVCDCEEIRWYPKQDRWLTIEGEKLFDGTCITYWDNKNKKVEAIIKKGRMRENRKWYENGKMKSEDLFTEESKDKSTKGWFENGNKSLVFTYKDGTLDSIIKWDETGKQIEATSPKSRAAAAVADSLAKAKHEAREKGGKRQYLFNK